LYITPKDISVLFDTNYLTSKKEQMKFMYLNHLETPQNQNNTISSPVILTNYTESGSTKREHKYIYYVGVSGDLSPWPSHWFWCWMWGCHGNPNRP